MATAACKAEAKVEPKEVEENSEPPLKYKTWVLKVSVHCEGCKRKVTKILKNIDGVYKTEVDMKLQKVTVTGNVEAETLMKKLTKAGKHAELWPDQKPHASSKNKKKNKGKGKEKQQSDSESSEVNNHGGSGSGDTEKDRVKVEVVHVQDSGNKSKNEGSGGGGGNKKVDGGNMVKASEGGGAQCKAGGDGQVKESKPEVVRQTVNMPSQSTVAEKKSGGCESDCEVEKSGGSGSGGGGAGGGASGSGGKNKKKKGQKGIANVDEDEGDEHCGNNAPPSTETPNHGNVPHGLHGPYVSYGPPGAYVSYGPSGPPYGHHGPSFVQVPANHSPPRHHRVYEYQYPRHYRPQAQAQSEAVNYQTAYTTSSYGASHYAAPPPYSHSYTYVPPSMETETQPPSSYCPPSQQYYPQPPPYSSPPADSFELFSDENPNGCHIM